MKKTNPALKQPSLPARETNKENKTSNMEIVVSLTDLPLELKKKEANKPLYLTRYE